MVAALNGWLAPRFGPDLRLEADKDAIPALAAEREAVWTRIGQAPFLTPNEKRAELGVLCHPGMGVSVWDRGAASVVRVLTMAARRLPGF